MQGMLYVFATADVVTTESAEHGDADRRGWVSDLNGSEVEESRNYVRPLVNLYWPLSDPRNFDVYLDEDDVRQEVRSLLYDLGAYDNNGDGTLYAADSATFDYSTDEAWLYALHAFVKHNGPNGWTETPVDITTI